MSSLRQIVPSDAEIDAMLGKAINGADYGSAYPGMSYEEGVLATIDWIFGNVKFDPFEDE